MMEFLYKKIHGNARAKHDDTDDESESWASLVVEVCQPSSLVQMEAALGSAGLLDEHSRHLSDTLNNWPQCLMIFIILLTRDIFPGVKVMRVL